MSEPMLPCDVCGRPRRARNKFPLCNACQSSMSLRYRLGMTNREELDDQGNDKHTLRVDTTEASKTPRQTLSSPPGSAERIRALRERVLRGEATWRKGDAGFGTLD